MPEEAEGRSRTEAENWIKQAHQICKPRVILKEVTRYGWERSGSEKSVLRFVCDVILVGIPGWNVRMYSGTSIILYSPLLQPHRTAKHYNL